MATDYKKPVPRPSVNPEVSAPFWAGTKKHELWLQYSKGSQKFFFPPREVSPGDLTPMEELVWTQVSGKGRIYSYTTIYQPAIAAFAEEAPYVHALIQLDEGARMVGNIVDMTEDEVRNNSLQINTRVEAVFEDVTPDWTLIKWRRIED
ncbi:MAG: Zn-ribbon domain-containing OB-fold protein [Dehalococcoidia bacterium]|tara:strand:- start:733 stop:1179 length:447 start_codon:yes stop_codon:yes gene_type:complete